MAEAGAKNAAAGNKPTRKQPAKKELSEEDIKKRDAKLAQLKKMSEQVRTGGRGTVRRKTKAVHKSSAQDDKKLQSQLKRLGVQPIGGIDEINMFLENGKVLHFKGPKLSASFPSNTYVVTGQGEEKAITELLPGIIDHLGAENLKGLSKASEAMAAAMQAKGEAGDDDAPALVDDIDDDVNFEETAKAATS